ERIDAERLQQLGVINAVGAEGAALDDALALCERLNARAPNTLASIKELVNEAQQSSLHQQLGHERDHLVRNLHHANGGEGIAAFLAKRPAQYRGLRRPRSKRAATRVRQLRVLVPMGTPGPCGDNVRSLSHSQDRPWTNQF